MLASIGSRANFLLQIGDVLCQFCKDPRPLSRHSPYSIELFIGAFSSFTGKGFPRKNGTESGKFTTVREYVDCREISEHDVNQTSENGPLLCPGYPLIQ